MENGTAVAALNGGGATPQLMMDTSTTADEEMNGLDLSTKSNNSITSTAPGPISLTISSSNGSTEGTPTPGTPLNGSPEKGLEAGQISPSSLRRSTRASAIKAQQKIKDGDVPQSMEQENSVESEDESTGEEKKLQEPLDGESAAKKRKLENGKALDQFSHEFSIKMEDDGGVYMLDEGSELSSLNETEIETLKKCYDKLLARELTSEQKEERTRMIKQAEADLRNEEAKLTMLKKMRSSQIPKHNPVSDLQRKLAANVAANSAGAAYKPPVAGTTPAAKNNQLGGHAAALANLLSGKGGPQAQAQLMALLQSSASSLMPSLTPQQKEIMSRMGQMGTAQLMAAAALQQRSGQPMSKEQQAMLAAAILQQTQKQQAAAVATSSNSNAAASSAASAAVAAATTAASSSGTSTPSASSATAASALAAAAATSGATTAQKLAAARHAFRKTADGQLVSQTVMPKACPNELFFIPNPNAPDFLYMLGLDQVVGRVLKDKNAIKTTSERPYECEECGSDFATGWKCIGTKEDDLHLYCEGCLRQAQKKKLRHDRNSQLKKIYAKVTLQEKEFEKQISDGKLDGMLANVFAQLQGQNAAAAAAARPTAAASPAVQNLSTKPATPSVPSPAMQKPATPLSTPSGSKTTSSMNSSSTSSGTKRPATANNQQQLQTQLAQLAQLARANPMMAAMMSGGLMGGQAQAQAQAAAAAAMSYGPMFQQQMQQMQQLQARMQQANNNSSSNAAKASSASTSSASASNSSSNNAAAAAQANMAMTMLAQAMQSAQNRNAASNSSNNVANSNALAMAQFAALTQAQSPFANPQQLIRQMQLAAAQMQKNAAKK